MILSAPTPSLQDFTGIDDSASVRKLTHRLAGSSMEWLKLERPEPPRYHVLASDVEMCALWYDYARVHAGAELALLLDPPEARPSPPVASTRN